MELLHLEQTSMVSGAIRYEYTEESYTTFREYESVTFTIQFDGSTPPELQKRIDAGESYESMKLDLLVYQHLLYRYRFYYPERFTVWEF